MGAAQDERLQPLDVVRQLPHIQALWALQEQFAQDGPRSPFRALDADDRRPLYQAATLLAVAIDHLVALELLVRSGGIPTWAPFSLLRPAIETSERASWLLEGKGRERIERSLAFEWAEATETGKDNAALLAAADGRISAEVAHEADRLRVEADARRRELLGIAARLGLRVAMRQPRTSEADVPSRSCTAALTSQTSSQPRSPGWPCRTRVRLRCCAGWSTTSQTTARSCTGGCHQRSMVGQVLPIQ